MSATRDFLLGQLKAGERGVVARVEPMVRAAIVKQHGSAVVEVPLPRGISEAVCRTLVELHEAAGWRASIKRTGAPALMLRRGR